MQRARLIPVSGIGSEREAEQRAASAFLAVLTAVRELSTELLSPLGASKAHKAVVDCFTEVTYRAGSRTIRPDGLIRVTYGKNTWTALVEFKTGDAALDAEQVNAYWDLAREHGYDHIITVSNEIAAIPGEHPTEGLRVRSNSPVQVTHISWTAILTSAIRIKQHRGVEDPDQAWILGELIRYLEHPASGALAFSDMGPSWTAVRDAAKTNSLSTRDDAVADISGRFDQLLRFAALTLGSEIGQDVAPALPRSQRDPKARIAHLVNSLCSDGQLGGGLRIPHTAGDLEVTVDLRGQTISVSTTVQAPGDKGGRGSATWLVRQLDDAPGSLVIEAYAKGARRPITTTLAEAREDRSTVIGDERVDPARFTLVLYSPMGPARKSGKRSSGFIESVLQAINTFYETTLQDITPWQPKAPKRVAVEPDPAVEEERAAARQPSWYSPPRR